ncbi:MAG: hypothetical protein V1929_05130 [bacterium]
MNQRIFIVVQEGDLALVGDRSVLPLRLDLLWKARKMFGDERVIDAAGVLTSRDVITAKAEAFRWFGAFVRYVQDPRTAPWMEALGYLEVREALFLVSYYQRLVASLHGKGYAVAAAEIPTALQDWHPELASTIWRALGAVLADARDRGGSVEFIGADGLPRRGPPPVSWYRMLLRAMRGGIGRVLNSLGRIPLAIKHRGSRDPSSFRPADVALFGVQVTDCIRQVDLAASMEKRFGDRFIWIHSQPDRNLEHGEKLVFARALKIQNRLRVEDVYTYLWRSWTLKQLAWFDSTWELAGILTRRILQPIRMSRSRLFELLVHVVHAEPALAWHKWDRLLRAVRPRVAVGNSAIHEMSLPIAWCRRNNVPFCLVPTGGYYESVDSFFVLTGDHLFQYGRLGPELFRRGNLFPTVSSMPVCGPIFVRDEVEASRHELKDAVPCDWPERKILYLETMDLSMPNILSPGQMERWFVALARACAASGCGLVLRPHPRDIRGSFYRRLAERMRAVGADVDIDEGDSLVRSLFRTRAVIARSFDTACLKTLVFGTPLLSFMPERGWPPMDHFMRRAAHVPKTEQELTKCFGRIMSDEPYRQALLRRQDAFKEHYLDMSIRDGWERIADFAADLLDPGSRRVAAAKPGA